MNAAVTRTVGLARFNLTLMMRNRTTMIYGVIMPLLPLALLFTLNGAPAAVSASMITTAWLMALIFPGYYNLLSMFVSRRDELVLKRLRTGEIRDGELIVSMALPGALLTVLVLVLAVPIALVAGVNLPLNPVMLLVGVLFSIATFAAFALWTASWTKTAEAAQLTSAPVMVLALAGTFAPMAPESVGRLLDLTPGAAVGELTSITWFGLEPGAETATLSFLDTFTAALPAIGVLVAWTAFAIFLASRSLRWEPRV